MEPAYILAPFVGGLAAMGGGMVGERFHHRVDRVGYSD
jgi:hypothetical protein